MLPISTVERETGLTKDTLRKWEIRYGFPQPARRSNGERLYSSSDLDRLLTIKRLLDNGSRPSEVVPLALEELNALAGGQCMPTEPHEQRAHGQLLDQVWHALKSNDPPALQNTLNRALMFTGLDTFVLAIIPLLNQMVGDGWANGSLAIHQEHLYSYTIRKLLLDTLGHVPPLPGRPKVLLSTPTEERHDLGMLMAHSVLALSGAHCISLGPELSATELAAAARSHRVQIVALSFSVAFPKRRILPFLDQLLAELPDDIQVWAGGAAVDRLRRKPPGVHTFASLELAAAALRNFPEVVNNT